MACRVQRRICSRRKLHILRALANSNNSLRGKRRSIPKSTIAYIYKLKVALESIKREYENAVASRRECLKKEVVKVEKVKGGRFVVRIKCEKGSEKLVSILEAFEEMRVNVENAKVSCEGGFTMDAIIAVPQQHHQTLDVTHLTEALLKAIAKQNE